jgi:hypothetical protein
MQLLHQEINVEPGIPPQQDLRKSGSVGFGRAVLRIDNNTKRINAYKITVSCEDPRWQSDWCKLDALDAPTGVQVGAAGYRPDEIGLHREFVKVFVLSGATRDIAIDVEVPRSPIARAGVYRIKILIDVSVTEQSGYASEEQRQERDAVVIVRPFYEWSLQVTPGERKVGVFRRRDKYEVQIANLGNDWLYCDLTATELEQVDIATEVQRIAVPPSTGTGKTSREVPMKVFHRKRIWRGPRQQYHLQVSAQRVDAPSVAPLSDRARAGDSDANYASAVIARDTGENPTRIINVPKLVFGPLIPATLTDFFRALAASARSILFFAIGLIVAAHLFAFLFARFVGSSFRINVKTDRWVPGQKLGIGGSYAAAAVIVVKDDKGEPLATIASEPNPLGGGFWLPWDQKLAGHSKVLLVAYHAPLFSYLQPIMPHSDVGGGLKGGAEVQIVGAVQGEPGFVLPGRPTTGTPSNISLRNIDPSRFPLTIRIMDGSNNPVGKPAVVPSPVEFYTVTETPEGMTVDITDRDGNPLKRLDAATAATSSPVPTEDKPLGLAYGGSEAPHQDDPARQGGGAQPVPQTIPAGYSDLMSALAAELDGHSPRATAAFKRVLTACEGASRADELAILAFAQSSLGQFTLARESLAQAKRNPTPSDSPLIETAEARLVQMQQGAEAAVLIYDKAVNDGGKTTLLLPFLAEAEFEAHRDEKGSAGTVMRQIEQRGPNEAEKELFEKLQTIGR